MTRVQIGLGVGLLALLGCSDASSGRSSFTGGPGASGTTGGTQTTGGGIVPGGGQGGSGIMTQGNDGGQVSGDAACVAESRAGEHVPVDLYVMQDKSGSMGCHTGPGTGAMPSPMGCGSSEGATGPTRWASLTSAIQTFVNSPGNAGLGIGIGFFPIVPAGGPDQNCLMKCNGDCACTTACGCKTTTPILGNVCICGDNSNQSCNAADYAVPAVEIAQLPGAAAAINNAIGANMPNGGTPTTPALQGALQHAKTWAMAHPDRKTAVVYSTDGQPSGCDANDTIANAAAQAAAALAGTPSVQTYVIGVGADLVAGLNQVAVAGGTTKAYMVDTGGNVAQQLADALGSIRSNTLSCDYKIPPPSSGTLDYGRVNVQVQVGSAGSPMKVSQVPSKDACGTGPGWYYDNPTKPTLIQLCPATCDPLLQTPGSKLDVLIGCKTDVRVN